MEEVDVEFKVSFFAKYSIKANLKILYLINWIFNYFKGINYFPKNLSPLISLFPTILKHFMVSFYPNLFYYHYDHSL